MRVLAIATLDTKGEELRYLVDEMRRGGLDSLILDSGVMGDPAFAPSISSSEVARRGGEPLESLRAGNDRNRAVTVMAQGAAAIASELFERTEIGGVIAVGGSSGATIATAAMAALPFGVPKLLVSPSASRIMESSAATTDLTIMNSIIDIEGLNRITRQILRNAAGAMVGMLASTRLDVTTNRPNDSRKLVAATMMGVTTPCVSRARHTMEEHGFEVIVFPAVGSGGRTLEHLAGQGLIDGILDLTTGEIANRLVGGICDPGPDRLEAAGNRGIPRVVSCGAIDFVNFRAGQIPEEFQSRHLLAHNPAITLMRTTVDENRLTGEAIAEKLNRGMGGTAAMIPLKGFSALDVEGGPFWDPEADDAFITALEQNLAPGKATLYKFDLHINDPEFADQAVAWLEDRLA
jgi:uncharacterized protein (UPF0261 family)